MSGNVRGKVDIFVNTGDSGKNCQEFFKGLYDFLVSHPNMTLVARNSGALSTSGDTAYWDQSGPFKTNAWAVFKLGKTIEKPFTVYFQIQLGMSGDFGNVSPGSPGLAENLANGTCVAIQVAMGVGGDENPFKGTMNAGSPNDTRANPIWGVPTGGTACHVFPRSNNSLGAHTTAKQNFTIISQPSTVACRYHIIADDDSLIILADQSDDNSFSLYWAGTYEPRADISITRPFLSFGSYSNSLPILLGTAFGTTAGTLQQGGVVTAINEVRSVAFDRLQGIVSSSILPTQMGNGSNESDEYGIPFFGIEAVSSGGPSLGFLGDIFLMRETSNVATNDTDSAFFRAAFGSATTTAVKVTVPWSGVAAPKATSTRSGSTFVRGRVAADG